MRQLSIVILSKQTALLTRALASLIRTHRALDSLEVIVVDDGLEERPKLPHDIKYLDGAKPFCYARNVNLGIKAARTGSDIFLLNDDVYFVTHDALEFLGDQIVKHAKLGVITPVFARTERTPCQRLGHLPPEEGLHLEHLHYLTFAAAYLRREVIETVGVLDEAFVGYGYEDNDYSLRVRRAGFDLGVVTTAVVGHGDEFGRASVTFRGTNMSELMRLNRVVFIRKWAIELLALPEEKIEDLIQMISLM